MESKLAVPVVDEQFESEASDSYDVPPPEYRRGSESSPERASDDEEDAALFKQQSTSSHTREYEISHPRIMTRGLVITETDVPTKADKAVLYYVEISEFAPKKPDVTLHQLPPTTGTVNNLGHTGESAPIVGVAHFPKFSRQIQLGLGDPSTNTGMTYIEVQNPNKFAHGEYRMSFNGRSYAWNRTHDAAAGVEGSGFTRKLNRTSFQLTEMSTNEVVAVVLYDKFKSWRKWKLRIFKDLEGASVEVQQFKLLVFLSIAAILEKCRRRENRRRSVNSGGGP